MKLEFVFYPLYNNNYLVILKYMQCKSVTCLHSFKGMKCVRYYKIKECQICKKVSRIGSNGKSCYNCFSERQKKFKVNYKAKSKRSLDKQYLRGCLFCREKIPHLLEVHHKDKNHSNNKIWNLEVLCRSCHHKLHSHIYKYIFYDYHLSS